MLRAVLFDLDDTLFDQWSWLSGAWDAVARAAAPGVDRDALRRMLDTVCAEGSGQGTIIDRALGRLGHADVAVAPLLGAFQAHAPARLEPYPGVVEALTSLHQQVALGLVSDGDPRIQRNKLHALDLERHFDVVVFSDELGRQHRKPSPVPILAALVALGIEAAAAVYVGDRPDKDVVAAAGAGVRAIRVYTGEYRDRPDEPQPWATAPDVVSAIDGLRQLAAVA